MSFAPLSPLRRGDPGKLQCPALRMWNGGVRHVPSELGLHRNDGYEITLVTQGAVRWEVEGGPTLDLAGGDMCLMQPHVPHRGENDIIAPCGLYWVIFNPTIPHATRNTPFTAADLCRIDTCFRDAGNAVFRASPEVMRLVRIWEAWMPRNEPVCPEAQSGMRALLCAFVHAVSLSLSAEQGTGKTAEIQAAEVYFQKHFAEPFGMGAVARHIGLSESRFYERFRRETGRTPADYLQRLRCTRAREMLRAGTLDVTRIALACGFSSSQYFAKCFRKFTGCAPSAYRSRHMMH